MQELSEAVQASSPVGSLLLEALSGSYSVQTGGGVYSERRIRQEAAVIDLLKLRQLRLEHDKRQIGPDWSWNEEEEILTTLESLMKMPYVEEWRKLEDKIAELQKESK